MDTIDFGELFAFTAIDIYTREADILLAPELTALYGLRFLRESMSRRFDSHIHLIQTDGGPEFKADFRANVSVFSDRHRIARPYRKNEQSYIESFNRTVRKECLGICSGGGGSLPCEIVEEQVKKLVSAIELGPRWLEEVLAIVNLKDDVDRVKKERKAAQEKLKRMARTYIDGLLPEDEYNRQRKLIEQQIESLTVPEASAAEEAGKLLLDLPKLWSEASPEEQRRLLLTMLDAVYVDTKQTKSIVAIKPKPPFRPLFQVAAKRENSVIHIINGSGDKSPNASVFLVETGESRTPRPREATQNLLQA